MSWQLIVFQKLRLFSESKYFQQFIEKWCFSHIYMKFKIEYFHYFEEKTPCKIKNLICQLNRTKNQLLSPIFSSSIVQFQSNELK